MRRHVGDAVRAGALGFDTGRTTMHRTPAWDPVPGTFADRRELEALAAGLADAGSGVFELIPYGGAGEDAAGLLARVRVDGAAGAAIRTADQPFADPEPRLSGGVAREPAPRRGGRRRRRPHRSTGGGALRRRTPRLRHRDVAAVAVSHRRRSARQVDRRAARASARARRPRATAGRNRRPQRRDSRRHGAAGERLPAGGPRRARLRDVPQNSIVAIAKRRGTHPLEVMLDLLVEHDLRSSSSCRSTTPTSTPPARC